MVSTGRAGELGRSTAEMSVVRFVANTVVVDDTNDEFILVGFADEQDDQYWEALHFQRSYEFDEQDVSLGMDHVYVERGIQAGAAYGGINAVELYPDRVRVSLDPCTAAKLGDSVFEISFTLSPPEFERLRAGLRTVFEGFAGLSEHTAEPGAAPDPAGM